MPRLLRVVQGDRWDFADDLAAWNVRNDLPAAPFGDLRTSPSDKLSVWVVVDDWSNLDRVIAGLAASRPAIDSFEARVVDATQVEALGIISEMAPGQSRDKEANKLWHRHLVDLTYQKLGALANLLAGNGTPIERNEAEVTELIVKSVNDGHINIEDLRPKAGPVESSVWRVINEALKAQRSQG